MKKATGERQPGSKKRDISQNKEQSNIGRNSQYTRVFFARSHLLPAQSHSTHRR